MSNTTKLLDTYKITCGIETDMAAATRLKIARATISGWRHGNRHAEADTVELMCAATGENLANWLHAIEAERARTPAAARVWAKLAKVAACFALVASFGLLNVQTASSHGTDSTARNPGTVYIM